MTSINATSFLHTIGHLIPWHLLTIAAAGLGVILAAAAATIGTALVRRLRRPPTA